MEEIEQQLQEKIQEVFTDFEGKQDKLQKEYQDKLESILEDVTQLKFEKMAEVKVAFKNMDQENEENIKWRDEEIQQIKDDTEAEKQRQIKAAQFTLETQKAQLQVEKVQALKRVKEEVRQANQNPGYAEVRLEDDGDQIEPIPMVGDGGEMAPLRLQEFLTGNAPSDLGPVTAGFGPAVNAGEDYKGETFGRRHTGNFNFAKDLQDGESDDEDFNADATANFANLNKAMALNEGTEQTQAQTHEEEMRQMKEKIKRELSQMQAAEEDDDELDLDG